MTLGIIVIEGNVVLTDGTTCSDFECADFGCVFPSCAREVAYFKTLEEAQRAHPEVPVIYTDQE